MARKLKRKLPNPPITWEYTEDGGPHSGDIKHVDKVLINIDGEIYEWDSGMQIYSNSTYRWRFYKSGDTWYLERWSQGSSGWARDFTAKVSEA